MTAPEKDANWSRVVPKFAPPAQEPGPKANGLTQDWSREMAEIMRARDARAEAEAEPVATEPPRARHARRSDFLASVALVVTLVRIWAGTALIAAGTAVKGRAV